MVYEQEEMSPAKKFIERVGKRNLIIAGVVLLIGAAVVLNWVIFANRDSQGFDGYDQSSGMNSSYGDDTTAASADNDTNVTPTDTASDSYFSSTQVSRARARDEALEVLQSVVDNAQADDAAKTQALADISQIAKDMESESNIETLIVAKGFEQCVAVISSGKINVVVKAEQLTQSDIAIINEIVYEQAGIVPANINIVKK
ncbi:MAG: SpoIIIAH-like family protein [Clostridia bacterium]|nr:SpoIIIAH-like family protein [Clostridia bacterium]